MNAEALRYRFSECLLKLFLLASALAPLSAMSAAPQIRTQAPGYYRMMLGTFEVTALLDGTHDFPVQTVMTHIPEASVERDVSADDLTFPVQGSINAFLVNTGTKLILIDTGAGVLYGDCCDHLLANLRAAGYSPEQVDEVLLTHLHKDHVGGIVLDGRMAFPNAIIRTSKVEAEYWLNPANKAIAPPLLSTFFDAAAASLAPYIAAGRFKPFSETGQLEPGIYALAAPGHTPGHTAYVVHSETKTLIVWGDIIHVASVQLRDPDASVEYDTDAQAAQRSRRAMLQLAASKHWYVAAAHISFPGLGHIRATGSEYQWIPVNYDGDPALHQLPMAKPAQ
jgi:glyoxylase-like metal-dependent hydrolase (beta-lactamase superfamily II)